MTIANPAQKQISQHGFVEVLQQVESNQFSLNATVPIRKNSIIIDFSAEATFTQPTYLTVQVAANKHITLKPSFLQYINHSCSPNVFFNTDTMQLICLEDINVGEELCFFYPSTEWYMQQPFACNCGAQNCLQLIQGASFLSDEIATQYQTTSFIKMQLANRK